jgi:hypothetical protein
MHALAGRVLLSPLDWLSVARAMAVVLLHQVLQVGLRRHVDFFQPPQLMIRLSRHDLVRD